MTVAFIQSIDRLVARAEYAILVLLVGSLILILSAQVILRYFFASPIFWAEEVAVQILVIASFIGVSHQVHTGSLVRVDFLITRLSGRVRRSFETFLYLLSFGCIALLCYYGTRWVSQPEIKSMVSPTSGIPRWYNYAGLVCALYLMSWHIFVKVVMSAFRPDSRTVIGPAFDTETSER